jgi:hypothetical protein
MMDINQSIKILPSLSLMDYIATDVTKNNSLSMRAKLMKSIALADIGMINESITMLLKVVN